MAATALGLAIGMVATGCGKEGPVSDEASEANRLAIDLQDGSYAGVGVGDSEADMVEVFGGSAPASLRETAAPLGGEQGSGPREFNPWPSGSKPRWFRYENVAFFVAQGRISVVMVTDPRARISSDLDMGDPLDDAKSAKEVVEISCGVVNEGTEYEPYRACSGRTTAGHYVWFGGDSLANVTIGTVPLEGV